MRNIVVICIRVCVGLIFFSSGMARLFADDSFPSLTHLFFSKFYYLIGGLETYTRFIAFVQVIAGFLMLTQRFAVIGTMMLLPIVLNILMMTLSLLSVWETVILVLFLTLTIILLLADYQRLKFLFADEPQKLEKVDASRSFPFHDLVFLIGMFIVAVSPFLSNLSHYLGWFTILVGFLICFGIEYYEEDLRKMLKKQNRNYFE